jgi:hypothetical protein
MLAIVPPTVIKTKGRLRNRVKSINGSRTRRSTTMKITNSTTARASNPISFGEPQPHSPARSTAYATATIPELTRIKPSQSIRTVAPAGDIEGNHRRQQKMATALSGTLRKNTQRQLSCSVKSPPMNGPSAVPIFAIPKSAPMATAR